MNCDSPPRRVRSQIFGDDSSKTGHDYFVYGSIYCPQPRFEGIERKLKLALDNHTHEIKWSKARFTSRSTKFLNALFDSWPAWSYRCIVVSTAQINNAARIEKRAILRAKLIHKHLNTYARTSPAQAEPEFYVTLDKDDFDPKVLELTLNRAFWRDYEGNYDAFQIRGEHSHDHLLLQAVDLITGAVAWVWNGGLERDVSTKGYIYRRTLAEIVAKRSRLAGFKKKGQLAVPQGDVRTLGNYTVKQREKGFSIWRFDLTKSKYAKS